MVNRLKVTEAAEKLGVSRVTVYKYLKRHVNKLVNHVNKVDGTTYLSSRGVELLRGLLSVNNNANSAITSAGAGPTGAMDSVITDLRGQVSFLQTQVERIQEATWEKERRSDTIIMQLTNQLRESQLLIGDLRQQRQEAVVPEYETVDAQSVQEDIMEVDAVDENFVQDVMVEVCDVSPAVVSEPVQETIEVKEQGAELVKKAETAKPAKEKKPHQKHAWGIFKTLWVHMFQPELLREI